MFQAVTIDAAQVTTLIELQQLLFTKEHAKIGDGYTQYSTYYGKNLTILHKNIAIMAGNKFHELKAQMAAAKDLDEAKSLSGDIGNFLATIAEEVTMRIKELHERDTKELMTDIAARLEGMQLTRKAWMERITTGSLGNEDEEVSQDVFVFES